MVPIVTRERAEVRRTESFLPATTKVGVASTAIASMATDIFVTVSALISTRLDSIFFDSMRTSTQLELVAAYTEGNAFFKKKYSRNTLLPKRYLPHVDDR